jgi:LacI family transcriptional regulator
MPRSPTHIAARQPSRHPGKLIGVVAPNLESLFVSELAMAVGRAAHDAGYELLIYSLARRDRYPPGGVIRLLEDLAAGVIAMLPYEYAYLQGLASARVPVVTVDYPERRARYPTVATDNYLGGLAAVRHLLSLGHRRIAFLAGDERLVSARERARAYQNGLSEAGLPRQPELIDRGDFTEEGGHAATRALLRRRRKFTAVFAANDYSAFGAIRALAEAGLRVPEDVSVVGFDDMPPAAHAHPPLTTVRQPMADMGQMAVRLLLDALGGRPVPHYVVLPTTLVVRASTGPVRPGPRPARSRAARRVVR